MKGDPTQVDAHTPAVGLFALISLENELINSLSLVARYFKVRLQLQLSPKSRPCRSSLFEIPVWFKATVN